MARTSAFVVVLLAGGFGAACGGGAFSMSGSDANDASAGSEGGGAADSGRGADSSTSDGGTLHDASGGDSGATYRDGGATSDGGGTSEGGVTSDSGIAVDAGVGIDASVSRFACGATSCASGAECCVFDQSGSFSYACTPPACANQAPTNAGIAELRCDNAGDCLAGNVCCAWRTGGITYSDCRVACSTVSHEVQLCTPSASAATNACVTASCSSTNISDWSLPSSYGTCGGLPPP